jgi:signal transduction histidine kinase
VPLQVSSFVVGLCLLEKAERGKFHRQHQLLAESLAGQAATALQNAQLFSEIRSSRERLRYLTGKVVSAQEEERRRVSRELHDQAGQALTVLKMSLSTIKATLPQELQDSREQLTEAVDLADQTMEQIRMLAHDLRPPVLDTFSLNASLEGLCQEFAGRSNLQITYHGVELGSVSDAVAISFYRFLQEALTNVTKHAKANEVQVTLDIEKEAIALTVSDDGEGFTKSVGLSSKNGIGLVGAQERFELLGGSLSIKSTPGQGTRLTARAPLYAQQKEKKEP